MKEPIKPDDNNPNFQDDIKSESSPRSFMHYQSKVIIGLYTYLQENDDKDFEALFSNAINLCNALGSWIYGEASPKIVYPVLQVFIKNANKCSAENFSHLLDYINWLGNKLYKILDDNQWSEEHYYESFTIRKSNDITTGLFFLWRLGWLIVKINEISNENKIPIPLQIHGVFYNLFDALGKWIYHQEGLANITQCFQQFQRMIEEQYNSVYDEVLEEAQNTRNNIAKFLLEL